MSLRCQLGHLLQPCDTKGSQFLSFKADNVHHNAMFQLQLNMQGGLDDIEFCIIIRSFMCCHLI